MQKTTGRLTAAREDLKHIPNVHNERPWYGVCPYPNTGISLDLLSITLSRLVKTFCCIIQPPVSAWEDL